MTTRFFFDPRQAMLGVSWDRRSRTLTVCPLPCVGIRVELPRQRSTSDYRAPDYSAEPGSGWR